MYCFLPMHAHPRCQHFSFPQNYPLTPRAVVSLGDLRKKPWGRLKSGFTQNKLLTPKHGPWEAAFPILWLDTHRQPSSLTHSTSVLPPNLPCLIPVPAMRKQEATWGSGLGLLRRYMRDFHCHLSGPFSTFGKSTFLKAWRVRSLGLGRDSGEIPN